MSLILPVLVPSWRFFKSIEPSPRVQWALIPVDNDTAPDWQEFRPRPAYVSPFLMLRRLLWNPAWNESLFLVSCAERIQECPTDHSINEIRRRILHSILHSILRHIQPSVLPGMSPGSPGAVPPPTNRKFQFRLVFVHRDGAKILSKVVFLSDSFPVTAGETR